VRTTLVLAPLVLLPLAIADPNDAIECEAGGNYWPTAGVHQISPVGVAAATFYVDDRNYALGGGTWIYHESNGVFDPDAEPIWNLQRGGAGLLPDDEEICDDGNPAGPDFLIF
jgi:hypothetical protein